VALPQSPTTLNQKRNRAGATPTSGTTAQTDTKREREKEREGERRQEKVENQPQSQQTLPMKNKHQPKKKLCPGPKSRGTLPDMDELTKEEGEKKKRAVEE